MNEYTFLAVCFLLSGACFSAIAFCIGRRIGLRQGCLQAEIIQRGEFLPEIMRAKRDAYCAGRDAAMLAMSAKSN